MINKQAAVAYLTNAALNRIAASLYKEAADPIHKYPKRYRAQAEWSDRMNEHPRTKEYVKTDAAWNKKMQQQGGLSDKDWDAYEKHQKDFQNWYESERKKSGVKWQ